uniref:Uncharacterized protein n=1 Tax=Meloidogyne incognita TaxID=6306 RepID=A0A914NLY0_MELIC
MPKFFFQISPNSLLSIWYCIICSLLQGWLIFLGFERYRLYTEIQWPTGSFPRLWLTIFISVLGACIPGVQLVSLLASRFSLFLAFLGSLASRFSLSLFLKKTRIKREFFIPLFF